MHNDFLDEALERLHLTGPEFDVYLSNHGPMASAAIVHRGLGTETPRWVDYYISRLDTFQSGTDRIKQDQWQTALGDLSRYHDWVAYFNHELRENPWQHTLTQWWTRLLPGIAAGATHGLIRV